MSRPKILLLSPAFHGYWKAIEASLEINGYRVCTHIYDAPGNLPERILNKLAHELPERFRPESLAAQATDKAIAAFNDYRPDIVLVIKGDKLGSRWWQLLEDSQVRYGTWLYDELRRMDYTEEDMHRLGALASYSPLDAAHLRSRGFEVLDMPNAYDSHCPIKPIPEESISFVGARYSGRENTLRQLYAAGIPVRAYGRAWSRHPWDIARTYQLKNPGVPARGDIDRTEAYGVMASSPATLNIHGDQDGFTMRTFEAPGVGALQIIDRADVSRYYEVGKEILVYNSPEELIDICTRIFREPRWARGIREAGHRRTLAEHTFDQRVKILEQLWS